MGTDEHLERDAFDRLRKHLAAVEARLVRHVPPEFRGEPPRVQRRLALLELTRTIDDLRGLANQSEDGSVQHLWAAFYSHGWPKALTLFLDEGTKDPGAPLFETNPDFHQWALSVLHTCADIALCETAMALCRSKLMSLTRADESRFEFTYSEPRSGLEADECDDQEWVRDFIGQHNEVAFALLETAEPIVIDALKRNVRSWMDHYIVYDSEPILDDYFEAKGFVAAQQCFGQDLFPDDTMFGGRRFSLFRNAVRVLMGWSLKHYAFCGVLQKRHPTLDTRNILTITAELDRLEEDLAAQLGVAREDARLALELLTVDVSNKSLLKESGPSPMFVTIGDRRVIKSFAGACTQPYYFMVRALKARFPKDWDRAVDSREKVFRDEIYQLLARFNVDGFPKPLSVREAGRELTDVDAAVIDEANGELALFQLKWQEPFGHSMRERANRKENFEVPSNKWVGVMDGWMASRTPADVGQAIGLGAERSRRLKRVRLFVISREHSHFSGPNQLDPRAAWGNWFQLRRLIESEPDAASKAGPISFLWDALRERTEASLLDRRFGRREVSIGGVEVILQPPASP